MTSKEAILIDTWKSLHFFNIVAYLVSIHVYLKCFELVADRREKHVIDGRSVKTALILTFINLKWSVHINLKSFSKTSPFLKQLIFFVSQ